MEIETRISKLIKAKEQGISLGIYRITFGLLMCFSLLRFLYKGWVESCYLAPSFHFTYTYFHFIKPILEPSWAMYAIVLLAILLAILVAIGLWYRTSIICFFLVFTYLELIELSWYLNHYYFVSIIAFLLIWIPAHRCFSIRYDAIKKTTTPISTLYANVLRLQISMVYFFAGLSKLNTDWLLKAQPLKIWLKAKIDTPIIGDYFAYDWTAFLFSYTGMFYDLLIPFFLWNKKTRPYALIAVVIFHLMTAALFNIGMFPWIMMVGSLIFITDEEWIKIFSFFNLEIKRKVLPIAYTPFVKRPILIFFLIYFVFQIGLPIRHFFYPENKLWTERNYRFAWNVMLVEKSGSTVFTVNEHGTNRTWKEYPSTHLTTIQEKQMSFQADMIWEYVQYLKEKYYQKGITNVSIHVDCYVSFNGRSSQLFLPKELDILTTSKDDIYDHILDLK